MEESTPEKAEVPLEVIKQGTVQEWLVEYRQLQDRWEDALSLINAAKEALAKLEEEVSAPFQEEEEYLYDRIRKTTLILGHSVKTEVASALYTKGYTRRSWDSDRLEGYAAAHPEVLEFKKITVVEPTVRVKLNRSKER